MEHAVSPHHRATSHGSTRATRRAPWARTDAPHGVAARTHLGGRARRAVGRLALAALATGSTISRRSSAVLNLTDEERDGLSAPDRFRVDITPYFISLIDPDDPDDPIRRQVIPLGREQQAFTAMMEDSLAEDRHSPVPGLVHRYPDRVLMLITTQCASYCRYCTRSRIVGDPSQNFDRTEHEAQLEYLRRTPQVRDVLISGGDGLTLAPKLLESILRGLREIPHIEIVRIGSRVPVFLPQRIDDELCEMLGVSPAVDEPPLQPPQRDHPGGVAGGRPADPGRRARWATSRCSLPVSTTASTSSARWCTSWSRTGSDPTTCTSATWSRARGTSGRPWARASRSSRGCAGTPAATPCRPIVIDAPGGGGKIPVMPNYLISYSDHKVVLRNYEGYITTYEEPETYQRHDPASCGYCRTSAPEPGQSGVHGLLQGDRMWIEPRGFEELHARGNAGRAPAPGPVQVGALRRRRHRGPGERRRTPAPCPCWRLASAVRTAGPYGPGRSHGPARASRPDPRTASCCSAALPFTGEEFGVVLSTHERVPGSDGAPPLDETPRWRDFREQAIAAEDLGYASVWVPDHLLYRVPDEPTIGFWEAWTFLSALAAVTHRVEIGSWVLSLGFRKPALVAKQADALDEISDGRLILGLGAGWHPAEFAGLGLPFDHRGDRFEEALRYDPGPCCVRGMSTSKGPTTRHATWRCVLAGRGRAGRRLPHRHLLAQHGCPCARADGEICPTNTTCGPVAPSSCPRSSRRWTRPASRRAATRRPLVRTAGIVVLQQPDLTAEGPRASSTVPLAETDTWIETLRGYAAAGVAHVQVRVRARERRRPGDVRAGRRRATRGLSPRPAGCDARPLAP